MDCSLLLETILKPHSLAVRFLPILEVEGNNARLHALQCLVRGPRGTNLESPEILSDYARRKREESLVDRAGLTAVLREAVGIPPHVDLSVSVHAATLCRDHEFLNFLGDMALKYRLDLEQKKQLYGQPLDVMTLIARMPVFSFRA